MARISRDRMDMQDGRIDRGTFKKWGETLVGGASGTNTGSSYTVDLESGNVFNLILNANCSFTFSNPTGSGNACSFTLILKQDSTGGRTATWPSAVKWSGGTAPTLTTTADRFDVLNFFTTNGGTTWFGMLAGADMGAGLTTLTFVGSAAGSDTSIEIDSISPGTIAAGDFCVIWNAAIEDSGDPSMTGFVKHVNTAANDARGIIASKILVGDETTVTGANGSLQQNWIVGVWRPNVALASRTWTLGATQITSGNPTAQTIPGTGVSVPTLLVGQMATFNAAVSPRTTSPTMTEISGANTRQYAHYTIYNSGDTPTDTTYDMDDEGINNILQSGLFEFTAA